MEYQNCFQLSKGPDHLHFGNPLGTPYPQQAIVTSLQHLYCTVQSFIMPPYVYPLPTTTLLTFSTIFIDPSGTHTTVLADATAARTRVHLALKAASDNEAGSSALAVVEVGLDAGIDAHPRLYRCIYRT